MGRFSILIVFIIIAGILGCGGPQTSQQATPMTVPKFDPIIISGIDSVTSAPFTITTNEWVYEWSYIPDSSDMPVFSFFIYPRGETNLYTEVFMSTGETSGSSYSYAGKGEYYIKVFAANISHWEITIKPAP